MRICMMNDTFYRSGGVPIAIRRISEALTDADFCVAACRYDGRPEDLSWIPDGRFERFDLTSTNNPIHLLKELRRFKKWLSMQQCNLVHCHHRRLSVLTRLTGLPVLYTAHLVFPYVSWFRWLSPKAITAITPSVASNVLETTGQKVITCISEPTVFPTVLPPFDVGRVRERAVCIARLERVKGHTYLFSAWKILRDRGYRYELDLVGEGSLQTELEAQLKRDGLEDLIHFHGFSSNVSHFLNNVLFAILPSELEGQGIVTLEAAAMGRGSVLTAVPGSIDLLPPDRKLKNGVPYGNVEALADTIEEWFSHPAEVVEEGRRFFDFLKASCDPKVIAGQYRAVYEQMLVEKVPG